MTRARFAVLVMLVAVAVVAVVARSDGATASAGVPGLELVVVSSGMDSSSRKEATARCPAGKKVIGGGGRIIDGEGMVTPARIRPLASLEAYNAVAFEHQYAGYGADWDLLAFAICGDPLPGLVYVDASTFAEPGGSYTEVTATCPTGKVVVGTGGIVGWAELVVGESFGWIEPFEYGGTGYVVASGKYDENLNNPLGFNVVAIAVCADRPPGYEIRYENRPPPGTAPYTGRLLQANAQCPTGKKVLSPGFGGIDFHGTARVDGMFPTKDLDGTVIMARQPSTSNGFRLTAAAICAG